MPEGFETIPDWFSHENQGAGVAVTDFGDGQKHLVVLMVDNPPQQNRGLYRIGRNLDDKGRVTGGWTGWFDVPEWFSWENQGADIAVADLAGDGGRDLVVFMIDNPPQKNRGLYRIGKRLDANGKVAQWTPWIDVPNWFSWENQGGGIVVTPPDAQRRRNLIVFMIDNPPAQNRGLYRIGKALDANGNVTGGWTNWIDVPDWFSFENQGGSIAVADFDGDGSQDLVVFMIDNVMAAGLCTGENLGCYKVGRKLDANGRITKWDRNWSALPYWFSWENQGGSIDIATVHGKSKLFSLIVDNPPQLNQGLYQAVNLNFDPGVVGRWDPVFPLMNVAIHTSVLPNGKVLFWGRTDDDLQKGDKRKLDPHICTPWIWDPKTGQQAKTNPEHPKLRNGNTVNLFCAGHAFMPDGRLLVAGGHLKDGDGSPQASTYDYQTNTWEPLPEMDTGRWYPTVTALADGRMLVSAGSYMKSTMTIPNTISQIWDGHDWRRVAAFPEKALPLYPRLHVATDGQVFMSGSNAETWFLDIGTNAWKKLPNGKRKNGERQYAPSVMYDTGKVIYLGGGNDTDNITPTANAEIIDLAPKRPQWKDCARMHFRRRQHNATLLPDGTILVTGGTMGDGFNNLDPGRPVHTAELWDPMTKKWRMLAAEDIDRGYHSTAVLLPDATVLTAGSGEFVVQGKPNDPTDSHREAQIFHPPYLFRGRRPQITNAPLEVNYGEEFPLKVSRAEIGRISWIRLPSVTHAFDENQRINFLEFRSGSDGLTVTAPARPELCPPGHYMLFALSRDGVPSVAHILRIGQSAPQRHPALMGALAAAESQYDVEAKTPIEVEDEIVRQSTGTRVTIGLTSRCPYGLAACWAGAYEALTKLAGVEAVRPIANADTSTADLYLGGHGLPDLERWPEQFAGWANASYDLRGVEVRVAGALQEQDGAFQLIGPDLPAPVRLFPLAQGMKIQWDYVARKPQDATPDELQAYDNLRQELQRAADPQEPVRVTGPLTKTAAGWNLYVRKFESEEGLKQILA